MLDLISRVTDWYKNSSPQKKLMAALLLFFLLISVVIVLLGSSTGSSKDPQESTPLYFLGVMVKLIGVLLLIVLCAILLRRWTNLAVKPGSVRQLRLLETVRLSPRQTLYLVALGDQQLLIGATDNNISLLSSVDDPFSPALADETHAQQNLDFGSLVGSMSTHLPSEDRDGKE